MNLEDHYVRICREGLTTEEQALFDASYEEAEHWAQHVLVAIYARARVMEKRTTQKLNSFVQEVEARFAKNAQKLTVFEAQQQALAKALEHVPRSPAQPVGEVVDLKHSLDLRFERLAANEPKLKKLPCLALVELGIAFYRTDPTTGEHPTHKVKLVFTNSEVREGLVPIHSRCEKDAEKLQHAFTWLGEQGFDLMAIHEAHAGQRWAREALLKLPDQKRDDT